MPGVSCFHSLHSGPTIVRRRARPCIVVDTVDAFAKRYSVKVFVVVVAFSVHTLAEVLYTLWYTLLGVPVRTQISGSPLCPKLRARDFF